ncbi:MAG: hypothetical protein MUF71_22140 [Candidatus Kapabacteria bacterium]|nr:hypothetical protein [Candidatus Kapabacteria bacterium]
MECTFIILPISRKGRERGIDKETSKHGTLLSFERNSCIVSVGLAALLLGFRCVTTFASKFGASRLALTELVASGDGKAVGLRSGGGGLY